MAESFLFTIAERLLEKIALLAAKEVSSAFNFKSNLRKLQETMSTIKAVLLDAEQKQHHNERLRLCLGKLRDIFYDAEDVLDDFECDARLKKVWKRRSIRVKVRSLLSYSFPFASSLKIGHKIKEINARLDELASEWNRFDLRQQVENRRVIHRETHSFVHSSNVIGRDEDKTKIINLLTQPSENGNAPVIPIVGMGGLGKTTLAQFIYNDKQITEFFPLRIWVCVTDVFDLARILKEIICSINSDRCDGLTFDALQNKLRNLLNDREFLLVLDDVWNEELVKWIDLRNLLITSDKPSKTKILVTTRSLKVASIMSRSPAYELKALPRQNCLALFEKWAFGDEDGRQYPAVMEIGEQIVEKCKGVPLAVRTLGSLLFSKKDETEWISIRDNDTWKLSQGENDIMPILKLSYHHLPSHLQRCLAYLSLRKKESTYVSTDVIQFWMANRLLECPKQKDEREDIGAQYLKDLWSRCLIQEVEDYGCYFTFKMHDLIHDLALDVSQIECKIVHGQTEDIDGRPRHLSFSDDMPKRSDPAFLNKLERLRTITVYERSYDKPSFDQSFVNFCISNFKYLRGLDLSYSLLKVLPGSIGKMKQLRYLNLRGCDRLKKLPSSFYKLQSLETLYMRGVELKRLPDCMRNLVSLRYLEISFSQVVFQTVCWDSLQYLCLYGCYREPLLYEGIGYLKSLRRLHLYDCFIGTLPRSLRYLNKLEYLLLENCFSVISEMEPAEEEDKDLHLNLKSFSMCGSYYAKKLPRLLLEASANTLQCIRLEECLGFWELPEWLQNLTALQKLEIIDCSQMSSLPEGFDRLTSLRQLKIEGCPELMERCQRDLGADWPKIARIPKVDII